jgi:hypothetical protein
VRNFGFWILDFGMTEGGMAERRQVACRYFSGREKAAVGDGGLSGEWGVLSGV